MPALINDCKYCGKLPEIGYDSSNYDYSLYCECRYPKRNDAIGWTIEELATDWNTLNPAKG